MASCVCAKPGLKLSELPLSHFVLDGNLEGLKSRLRLARLALGGGGGGGAQTSGTPNRFLEGGEDEGGRRAAGLGGCHKRL